LEDWKIRVSVLWIAFECGMIAIGTVEAYIPGLMEANLAQMTPLSLLPLAITMMIVPILAFLPLTLKDSMNRWVNIVAGIIFAVLVAVMGGLGLFGYPAGYALSPTVIAIVQFVFAVLIVWHAWKSKPKG